MRILESCSITSKLCPVVIFLALPALEIIKNRPDGGSFLRKISGYEAAPLKGALVCAYVEQRMHTLQFP